MRDASVPVSAVVCGSVSCSAKTVQHKGNIVVEQARKIEGDSLPDGGISQRSPE
jgi:hypothetical protein